MLPRFASRLRIGDGLHVSPFCLGIAGSWRVIPAAYDMGINFFFVTTDMHWPAYEASRRGLKALLARNKEIRDEIVVAGACYPTQPEFMSVPFQELIEAVPRMARVDVLVAGGVYGADLLSRVAVLRAASATMHARAVAASFHDRLAALAAANHQIVDLCYVRYNPTHSGMRQEVLPRLISKHSPLINFKSTGGFVPHSRLRALKVDSSLWYPEAPDYYRYALSRSQISGILFSVKSLRELVELAAALPKGGLTTDEEDHLDELAILTGQRPSHAR